MSVCLSIFVLTRLIPLARSLSLIILVVEVEVFSSSSDGQLSAAAAARAQLGPAPLVHDGDELGP